MRISATKAAAFAGLTAVAAAAHAQPHTFFAENFENWAGNYTGVWSSNMLVDVRPPLTTYTGRYCNDRLTMTIPTARPAGGAPATYALKFDFICIDSWDGDAVPYGGPDTLDVLVNGSTRFSYTFSNLGGPQTYPHSPDVGPVQMVYDTNYPDSIYRNIVVPFNPGAGNTIQIAWQGRNLQGINDESWALDNISVFYTPTPAPSPVALLGLTALTALKRPKRRPGFRNA
jgi:hypothetical protein